MISWFLKVCFFECSLCRYAERKIEEGRAEKREAEDKLRDEKESLAVGAVQVCVWNYKNFLLFSTETTELF